MFKLIVFGVVGFFVYKWFKGLGNNSISNNDKIEEDLIECSRCHTFVPKEEIKYIDNLPVCEDCR